MNPLNEHRPQSILMLLQVGTLVAGSLMTRAGMKALGYPLQQYSDWAFPTFVRNWVLLLVLIAAAWCLCTVWLEERMEWFTQRVTIITGVALLAACVLVAAKSCGLVFFPNVGGITVSR